MLLLAIYPYGLFLFAGYTESLFLLLIVAVFFLLQREQWWLASICAMLLPLTRVTGILILVPFLVRALQRFWPQWRASLDVESYVPDFSSDADHLDRDGLYMVYLYHI